jgi:cobalt-precorrin-7 (C5)-methyltransferase
MKIIGVGAGPEMLTFEAARAIREARRIYGSNRAIELALSEIDPKANVNTIEDYKKLRELPDDAVVLSTGDPMLSGLGFLEGEVIPGISSMQVACARLGVSLLNVTPVTVHGRKMEEALVAKEIEQGKCVFLLTDESSDIAGLCSYLSDRGLVLDIAVLTNLGYPDERITKGDTSSPPKVPGLSCVMIGELGMGSNNSKLKTR